MFCIKCGHENSADVKFRVHCWTNPASPAPIGKGLVVLCLLGVFLFGIMAGMLIFGGRLAAFTLPEMWKNNPTLNGSEVVKGVQEVSPSGQPIATGSISSSGSAVEIVQIVPMSDGAVAVLYSDGRVAVAGNDSFSETVEDWEPVRQLFYRWISPLSDGPILVGLTQNGAVLTTDADLSYWKNVQKLYLTAEGILGVTRDGKVLAHGTWADSSLLTSQTDVKELVYSPIEDIYGCLKQDGTVYLLSDYLDPNEILWRNVRELRNSGHAFYCILNDGSVTGGVDKDAPGLRNAVKVVHYDDWLYGISSDGRLLTYNGGNIYSNFGCMVTAEPGNPNYAGEVDIKQFNQVKDILVFWGLILLNQDGTVEPIGDIIEWDLSRFDHINKIYGSNSDRSMTIYGIRQDGSVIAASYDPKNSRQSVTDAYRSWNLQDIFVGEEGVVGLTTDGKLVGDGIYEKIDFSVFNR